MAVLLKAAGVYNCESSGGILVSRQQIDARCTDVEKIVVVGRKKKYMNGGGRVRTILEIPTQRCRFI